MARSLREVYIHLVWSTRDRLPLLTADLDSKVHARVLTLGAFAVCNATIPWGKL